MNKRQIIASLNNIANELDNIGLIKEANSLTNIMKRLADEIKIKREIELLNNPYAEDFESEEEAKNIAKKDFID
jgi:hypothetical protein